MLEFVIHILRSYACHIQDKPALTVTAVMPFRSKLHQCARRKTHRIMDTHFFPDVRIIELMAEHGVFLTELIHLAGVKSH